MGERVATRPLEVSNYALQVNMRETIFHNIWDRGHYPFRGWIPNAKDEFFHSEQQWQAIGEEPKLN